MAPNYPCFLFFAWYILIIIGSSIPHLQTPKLNVFNSIIRLDYAIHFLEYFILSIFFILWRMGKKPNTRVATFRAFKIMFLYGLLGIGMAFLGEVYQIIIPGRSFNPVDGIYNALGIIAGILCMGILKKQYSQG